VITIVDKHSIINLKKKGHSNRKIAKMLRINRKTVAKYWYDHVKQNAELLKENIDVFKLKNENIPIFISEKTKKAIEKNNMTEMNIPT
jgi:DNA-binding CsgD family transcriptional regulator